jgi:hypothetical protein
MVAVRVKGPARARKAVRVGAKVARPEESPAMVRAAMGLQVAIMKALVARMIASMAGEIIPETVMLPTPKAPLKPNTPTAI